MNKIVLSDNHRRSISSSLLIIERMMKDIERALLNPPDGVMSKTVIDIPDLNVNHFLSILKEMEKQMNYLAGKYNLKTEEVKLSRMINSRKAKMWETIKDTSARKLKGYGKFPAEFAEEFDTDMKNILRLIESL